MSLGIAFTALLGATCFIVAHIFFLKMFSAMHARSHRVYVCRIPWKMHTVFCLFIPLYLSFVITRVIVDPQDAINLCVVQLLVCLLALVPAGFWVELRRADVSVRRASCS